jgi:hypothetical protein
MGKAQPRGIGKSSPIILAKPVGVGAAFQPWIPTGERFADAHRGGKRFIVQADVKLTAFVELESAIGGCRELG